MPCPANGKAWTRNIFRGTTNPFNPSTEIRFELLEQQNVRLAIYDLSGKLVRDLAPGSRPPGLNRVRWDGKDQAGRHVAAGVYHVRLKTPTLRTARSLTLVR